MAVSTSPVVRFVRCVLLFWVTFILTQPVAVHGCAMRNGTLRSDPPAGAASGAMSASMPGTTGHMMADPTHDMSRHDGAPTCHCIGDCAVAHHAALLPPAVASVPAPPQVLLARVVPVVVERAFDAPSHLQPPATAPPVA